MSKAVKIGRLIALLLMLLPLMLTVSDAASDNKVDWDNVDTIDIYADGIGSFLDVDYNEFQKSAKLAYDAQDYEKAAKYYLVCVKNDIHDSTSIYNLACCYGLLGAEDEAAFFLEKAVKSGFDDLNQIKNDPDFDKVRDSAPFKDVVGKLEGIVKEKQKELGELKVFDAQSFMQCRIHFPENYDNNKTYPLVIGLHGLGGSPDTFVQLWKRFGSDNFIFASPQAPYPFSTGSEIGYSWSLRDYGEDVSTKSATMSSDYVASVVGEMKKNYKIDKVYLMGFSQDCGLTLVSGIEHSNLFDGLICFGGWLDDKRLSEETIKAANKLKVFIAHGNKDNVVEFKNGQHAYDVLKKNGYDVMFYEFDGAHAVPEDAVKAAVKWFGL